MPSSREFPSIGWAGAMYVDVRLQWHHWLNRGRYRRVRVSGVEYSLAGFDDLRTVFIHVPKTGGISINRALYGTKGGGHRTFMDYKRIFGPWRLRSYFSFAMVRHPVSRLVSAFNYLKRGGMAESDRVWVAQHWSDVETLEDLLWGWLTPERMWSGFHFMPQWHFVCDQRGMVGVDFLGRFESLANDFEEACRRAEIERSLEVLNQSGGDSGGRPVERSAAALDRPSLERVFQLYRRDYETFGYDPFRF